MARGQRDRDKEQLWRRHVAAWRRSGQSVRAYCLSEGLSEPSFYSWRRVLAEREPCGAPKPKCGDGGTAVKAVAKRARGRSVDASTAAAAVSAFVPVRLVEETPTLTPAVEVVLRCGRVVRVAAGFAAKTLRDVVAALEDLPC